MSSRRDFMKTVVSLPIASTFLYGKDGGFGGPAEATGSQGAELVGLEELPATNPQQSGVLYVVASPEAVRKNHGWWTGIKIPLINLDKNPLKIATKEYTHGLGCHANSKVVVRLPGPGKTFSAIAGLEPASTNASDIFSVTVGDRVLFRSGVLKGEMEGIPVNVELGGATEFTLEVEATGKKVEWWDRGDWADAKVLLADGKEVWLDEMLLCYPLESGPIEKGADELLNIAPFGYVYRPDRPPDENPPETQFINTGNTSTTPLGGILWAERRPIRRVELHFPQGTGLDPNEMVLRLVAASWWKAAMTWALLPLEPVVLPCTRKESNGDTLVYELEYPILANHLSLHHKPTIAHPPVPEMRVFSDSALKKMKIEIEWGLSGGQERRLFDGRLEVYNGRIEEISPVPGKSGVIMQGKNAWRSTPAGKRRRGIVAEVSYAYNDAVTHGNSQKTWYPNRTVITVWTSSGSFSFVPRELESGEPIWMPNMGFFVAKAGSGEEGRQFAKQWTEKHPKTVRQMVREREELTLDRTLDAYFGKNRPPIPAPGDDVKDKATLDGINLEPGMRIEIPDKTVLAAWRLAYWHVKRRCLDKNANGDHIITDYWYGPIGVECTTVFQALDSAGCEEEIARTAFEPWFKDQGKIKSMYGWFKDMNGTLMRAAGDAQEDTIPDGTACMLYAIGRHYQLTGNKEWLKSRLANVKAACEWIVRQRQFWASMVGAKSLGSGLFPPCGTGDLDFGVDPLVMQTTQVREYTGLNAAAEAIADVDPPSGAELLKEAESFRQAILAAWDKSIALSPVIKVRDGAYRRFLPSIVYLRGLCSQLVPPTSAEADFPGEGSWLLDGNWSEDLSFNILSPDDPRLDEALDVVEDNLCLFDDSKTDDEWFSKTSIKYLALPAMCYEAMAHLWKDDVPNFLRTTLVQYACEVNPQAAYVFREGPTGGSDKIQETSAFVLRIRSMLVMEDGNSLWLARATPRTWLEQGQKISVQNAPSDFGSVGYEIVSDINKGKIGATVEMPSRRSPQAVFLRLRHPKAAPIKSVTVSGKPWVKFNRDKETIDLAGLKGKVTVEASY